MDSSQHLLSIWLQQHEASFPFTIKETPLKGRCVIASCDHKPGDLILVSTPIVMFLTNEYRGMFCSSPRCSKEASSKCSKCSYASYCSRACQLEHFPLHKLECSVISTYGKDNALPPTLLDRLVIVCRVISLLHYKKENPAKVSMVNWNYEDLELLRSSLSEYNRDIVEGADDVVKLIGGLFPESLLKQYNAERTPKEWAMSILLKFKCNSYQMFGDSMRSNYAQGLFPDISLLNHSCAPNCQYNFSSCNMYIRCLKPITKGDEITISYISPAQTVWQRRSFLLKAFNFTCDCSSCVFESSPDGLTRTRKMNGLKCTDDDCEGVVGGGPEKWDAADIGHLSKQQLECSKCRVERSDGEGISKQWLELKGGGGDDIDENETPGHALELLHGCNVNLLAILEGAANYYADYFEESIEHMELGYIYMMRALPACEFLYGGVAYMGYTLFYGLLGYYALTLKKSKEAKKYLGIAVESAKVSHGVHNSVYLHYLEQLKSVK